jgi:hypothetical protein
VQIKILLYLKGAAMSNFVKKMFPLLLLLFLASLSACTNSATLYRDYAGENENYKISMRSQLEYNGSPNILKGLMYNDENLYTMSYIKIEYIGKQAVTDLQISKVNIGDKFWERTLQADKPNYLSLFDENDLYTVSEKFYDTRLYAKDFYVQFTYSDGTTERVDAKLTDFKGELKDLDLVIPEINP